MLGVILAAMIPCGISDWPPILRAEVGEKTEVVQVDLSLGGHIYGREYLFGSDKHALLISPAKVEPNWQNQVSATCTIAKTVSLQGVTVVDNGPTLDVRAAYVERDSVAVLFYAYDEDWLFREDDGLNAQGYEIQLDTRQPMIVEVTGKPGVEELVRFDHVAPGPHKVTLSAIEKPSDVQPLWTVTLVSDFR